MLSLFVQKKKIILSEISLEETSAKAAFICYVKNPEENREQGNAICAHDTSPRARQDVHMIPGPRL